MKPEINKTIDEFKIAYSSGKRYFLDWDFDEDGSVRGMNLSGVFFESCFLFLDFRDSNLSNAKFIGCNIKTADFRGSNLSNAIIKNCSVESTMFKGAITENLVFEKNYCFGHTTNETDFDKVFKNSDEHIS